MSKLDNVKKELKKIDRTVAWITRQINIQHSQLTNYDKGRQPLAYHHKIRIANLFKGVTVEDLFEDEIVPDLTDVHEKE